MAILASSKPSPQLHEQNGHLIRRAHQIAVSLFRENLGRKATPFQYAVLRALQDKPGIDQVTLAQEIALDTSSTADAAVRLEAKGLIVREVLPRGQRCLALTPAGVAQLARLMPGMDGLELGQRLREDRMLRHALRVALTGYGQSGDRDRTAAADFQHHLVKPVDPQALLDLVARETPGPSPAQRAALTAHLVRT